MNDTKVAEQQLAMEEVMAKRIELLKELNQNRINQMMNPSLEGCDWEEKTLTLRFPVDKWKLNGYESMHGGMITTAFDIAMGILSHELDGGTEFCPTANITVMFLAPVRFGKDLLIRAKGTHAGKRLICLTAEAWQEGEEQLSATATGQFAPVRKK